MHADTINRYFAYRSIADREKAKVCRFAFPYAGDRYANRICVQVIEALVAGRRDVAISQEFVTLHQRILFDESIQGTRTLPASFSMIHNPTTSGTTRSLILREAEEISSRAGNS